MNKISKNQLNNKIYKIIQTNGCSKKNKQQNNKRNKLNANISKRLRIIKQINKMINKLKQKFQISSNKPEKHPGV